MRQEGFEHFLEIEDHRLIAVVERQHDDAEADLQLRKLVQAVEHHLRVLAAFSTESRCACLRVTIHQNIRDASSMRLSLTHVRDALNELRFVHLVGDLSDDDFFAIFFRDDLSHSF